jgi:hypothetical protein
VNASDFGRQLLAAHRSDLRPGEDVELDGLVDSDESWLVAYDLVTSLAPRHLLAASEIDTARTLAEAGAFRRLGAEILRTLDALRVTPATAR